MEQEQTKDTTTSTKVAPEPRLFLIEHECGSMFIVNTKRFLEMPDKRVKARLHVEYDLRCPSCQTEIGQDLAKEFYNFLSKYKELTTQFGKKFFTLREIKHQDLDSLS